MTKIWTIAMRELNSFFDSLIAYILIAIFYTLTGLFTWVMIADIFLSGQASLQQFFFVTYYTLGLFYIPALTMRMFSEEKKTGTIELLLTKAVTDWQVVLGKFSACFGLILITLVLSLPYYFTVAYLGDVDHGAIWCGYLGILLFSAAFIGIGLFTSSITDNQIVAFLLSLLINLFLLFVLNILANTVSSSSSLADVLYYISTNPHYESFTRGIIDSKDIFYFLSILGLCLILTESSLAKRSVAK